MNQQTHADPWDGRRSIPLAARRIPPLPTLEQPGAPQSPAPLLSTRYKRKRPKQRIADFRRERAKTCDQLIQRLETLNRRDPPLDLASHSVTRQLLDEPSPSNDREYKHREDLIDAAICAWTAALWHKHGLNRCQILAPANGEGDGPLVASIIAPARPDQRRPMSHFLDIEMPERFLYEVQGRNGQWLVETELRAADFIRHEDGSTPALLRGPPSTYVASGSTATASK